jgi:DnaK suppressor protein
MARKKLAPAKAKEDLAPKDMRQNKESGRFWPVTAPRFRIAEMDIAPSSEQMHSVIVHPEPALYKGAREQEGSLSAGVPMRPERNKNGAVTLLDKNRNYRPSDKEPFMNERQREYFRNKLLTWKDEILKETKETLQHLQDENQNHPDLADRASSETDRAIELRARDRQRKLIAKIDAALQRLEDGTYGYCEETGEPISLRRLEARPIATLSIEAQERHERRERVYRDD